MTAREGFPPVRIFCGRREPFCMRLWEVSAYNCNLFAANLPKILDNARYIKYNPHISPDNIVENPTKNVWFRYIYSQLDGIIRMEALNGFRPRGKEEWA